METGGGNRRQKNNLIRFPRSGQASSVHLADCFHEKHSARFAWKSIEPIHRQMFTAIHTPCRHPRTRLASNESSDIQLLASSTQSGLVVGLELLRHPTFVLDVTLPQETCI
ncbi:hypothetical protein HCH54_004414 [Aspergillus fumigatus]